ncbi:right-handed parallel beta-helix repeat-containing protein [Microlunatus antarcticus]|uniref:Right handed beta helix domain-containing protein n=1 Tax=Microlunatus antarcticus TaxID=53388 RepID=A0A7W5JUD3_9ACTN|nr:right-handed parallel beta-helix repeat-containing protein [Microlunatus antarcticus]MBB3326231.1 hypothetical protein [Microlunatus antarcticus]
MAPHADRTHQHLSTPTVLARRAAALGVVVLVALTGPLPSASAATTTLTPEAFGAVGNGKVDDTAALRRALDALRPGTTLKLGAGKVYAHDDVLTLRTPRVRIAGKATLLATDESRSAVFVDADRVEIDDTTFSVRSTTQRWGTFDQMKLRLGERSGIVLRRVTVDGSAAAGIYLWGTSHFVIDDVRVRDTRADGIHVTGPSHDGTIRRAVVDRAGDDGIGIVSYQQDGVPVKKVLVDAPTVRDNSWGRGISVVGGEDLTLRKVDVRASSSAAVYIASEGSPWNTFAPVRVKVQGARLRSSNTAAGVDHGAFLVYAGNPGFAPRDISADKVKITGTRRQASSQVGIRADPGCSVRKIKLSRFTVSGGGHVFSSNVPASAYRRTGWKSRS